MRKIILLVDENPRDADLLRLALQDRGAELIYMRSAKEALAALLVERVDGSRLPDAILAHTDKRSLGESEEGFSLARSIRDEKRISHIPVALWATSPRPGDVEKAKAVGVREVFIKPATWAEFQHIVGKLYSYQTRARAEAASDG